MKKIQYFLIWKKKLNLIISADKNKVPKYRKKNKLYQFKTQGCPD